MHAVDCHLHEAQLFDRGIVNPVQWFRCVESVRERCANLVPQFSSGVIPNSLICHAVEKKPVCRGQTGFGDITAVLITTADQSASGLTLMFL